MKIHFDACLYVFHLTIKQLMVILLVMGGIYICVFAMLTANFFLTNISSFFSFTFVCMITNDTPPYLLQSALIMTSGLLGEQHQLRDVLSYVAIRAGAQCVMTSGVLQMLL